jgi:hypothetical protein
MQGETHGYSRDQVQQAERRAWAETDGHPYYFDGTYFWHNEDGNSWAVKPEATPARGWRHHHACNCSLCQSGLSSLLSPQKALTRPRRA